MKKILVAFGNGFYETNLIKSAKFLRDSLNMSVDFIFVKDLLKDEKMIVGLEPMYTTKSSANFNDILDIENKRMLEIDNSIKKLNFNKVETISGVFTDVINKEMKKYDMLMIDKDISLNDGLLNVLKTHYKPVILIGTKALENLDNITLANDRGLKINKSVYEFINNFTDVKTFTSITIENQQKANDKSTIKYLKEKNYEVKSIIIQNLEDGISTFNNSDLTVMGNLSKTFFIEKIIGKNGLKLLEQLENPIFIG